MAQTLVQRGILVPHRARVHLRAVVIFRGAPGVLEIVCEDARGREVGRVPPAAMTRSAEGDLTVAAIEGDLDATLDPGAYQLRLVADPPGEATVRSLDYVRLAAWS